MEAIATVFFVSTVFLFVIYQNLSSKFSDLKKRTDILESLKLDHNNLSKRKEHLDLQQTRLDANVQNFQEDMRKEKEKFNGWIHEEEKRLGIMIKEKTEGFPWLATAYADYIHKKDWETALALEYKKRPAKKAAEEVKEIAEKKRQLEKEVRVYKYKLQYYESLVPSLSEFEADDVDDMLSLDDVGSDDDPARRYLSDEEYSKLTSAEKFQRALDNYWKRRKSKWMLGRDYERYIGYCFEAKGYNVEYFGIAEGMADLGRDLIAKKGFEIKIVQCKYWSQDKTIHEKHIFQLHGTTTLYRIDHGIEVTPVFYTTTTLSERARQVASVLGVALFENAPFNKGYPCIKCNVNKQTGDKIYHLPFDQQYDSVIIEPYRGEKYVSTVAEAERFGFRRAFRWRGEK